jgi:glyoxylase-like metal-dependent hydrolase (beta-lactamase superfamily II)
MRNLLIAIALAVGCGPMTELGIVKAKKDSGGIVRVYSQSADGGHANIYWIPTEVGPIVINTPLEPDEAKKLRKDIVKPYRIYITEARPELFASLAIMRAPDIAAYTTPAIATEIQSRGDNRLGHARKKYGEKIPAHVDPPTPSVEERTHDIVGEVEIEIIPLGAAEAESSLAVFLPKTGELIAGDVVANKQHLDLTWGRAKVWQDRINELKALEPKLVYAGHGPAGGPEILDDTAAYLKFFYDTVGEKVKQGAPARITAADARYIKTKMLARFPKYGREELLDRSITAEYAVQLAELPPAAAPEAAPGAPATGGATNASASAAATTSTTESAAQPSKAADQTGSAAVDDLLSSDSVNNSAKSKKKKGKK